MDDIDSSNETEVLIISPGRKYCTLIMSKYLCDFSHFDEGPVQ